MDERNFSDPTGPPVTGAHGEAHDQPMALAVDLAGMLIPCPTHPINEDDSDPTRRLCECSRYWGMVFLFPDSVRLDCPIDSHHGPNCLCGEG